MKHLFVALLLIAIATPAIVGQAEKPIPLGVRQGEEAEQAGERNVPPPDPRPLHLDPAHLRQQADQLAQLAGSVPGEIDESVKGLLPQDLPGRLKRIEKLAKQLRSELSRANLGTKKSH